MNRHRAGGMRKGMRTLQTWAYYKIPSLNFATTPYRVRIGTKKFETLGGKTRKRDVVDIIAVDKQMGYRRF